MQKMSMHRVNPIRELPGPADVREGRRTTRDEQFLAMLNGYRLSGGLARDHDLVSLLNRRSGLNIGTLARWIVEGEVVHFEWQQETWFPMFQLGGQDMALRAGVSQVLKEFSGVLDPWETAQWLASPSAALGGRTPADDLALHPDGVFHSARCERYVVNA